MHRVARSSAVTLASTQFDVDLQVARRVGILAIPKHTISAAGSVRFRGWSAVPCFDSLTVGDATWTASGTPTRTAAAFTCADGIPLDLVGDDNGAGYEGYFRTVTFTGNAVKALRLRVAQSLSNAGVLVNVFDTTASLYRLALQIDLTTATPVLTATTGTVVSSTARGDGSFDVLVLTSSVTAANSNRIEVFPCGAAAAAATSSVYIGNVTAWNAASDQQVLDSGLLPASPLVYPNDGLTDADRRLRYVTARVFDSDTVGDSSWTASGTPTRTEGAFTCSDGEKLDLLGDDSGAAIEYTTKAITFTGNGVRVMRFRVARSSAYASHRFDLNDLTAGVNRLQCNVNFTAATPVVTIVGPDRGTVVSSTALGDSSWEIVCTTESVVAANSHIISVYPASGAAADTAAFYIGTVMAWDVASTDEWYTGRYSAEELVGFPVQIIHCPTSVAEARYWRCEVHDTTNAAGYVDLARLILADRYVPSINYDEGASLKLGTATTRTETEGGAAVFNVKAVRREAVFAFSNHSEDEVLANVYEMQRRLGTSGQLFFINDIAATYHMTRQSFLGTMRELSSLESKFSRAFTAFAITEEL